MKHYKISPYFIIWFGGMFIALSIGLQEYLGDIWKQVVNTAGWLFLFAAVYLAKHPERF